MNIIPAHISFAVLMLSLIVLSSCEHKDIMCPGNMSNQIEVCFEWDKAREADPEGMTLYFFSQGQGGRVWRFDISGRNGGAVELPMGEYSMIAYNNDLPTINISGSESFGSLSASLRKPEGKTYYKPCGMLYSAVVDYIEVSPCGVTYVSADGAVKNCPKGLVRCYPDSMSTLYTVIVKNVDGIDRVKSSVARLNGIAAEMKLGTATAALYPSEISFSLAIDRSSKILNSTAGAFSPEDDNQKYILDLLITRTDGKVFSRSFDVSDQVMNLRYLRNVVIIIDGLNIPDIDLPDNPGDNVGGIDVDVDGWDVVEIDLSTDIQV